MTSSEQKSFGLTKTIRRRRSTGSEIAEEWSINIEYLEMLKSLESNMEKRDLPDKTNWDSQSGCGDQISMVTLKAVTILIVKKWNRIIDHGDNEERNAEDIAPYTYWRRSDSERNKRTDILAKCEKRFEEEIWRLQDMRQNWNS